VPVALDCRFVRGLKAGTAQAVPTVVHEGRSLTCVSVDTFDERDKLATRATVSLVASDALASTSEEDAPQPVAEDGPPWQLPPGVDAPIIATLVPFFAGSDGDAVTTAVHVPWDEPGVSPEAICLATDLCVGPPVARALPDPRTPHPNPDISLRFARGPASATIAAEGRLARVADGVALVAIRAWAAGRLVATGTSASLLLAV
jgi:acyl-coenzyme A thioesterase PaaI-like protein